METSDALEQKRTAPNDFILSNGVKFLTSTSLLNDFLTKCWRKMFLVVITIRNQSSCFFGSNTTSALITFSFFGIISCCSWVCTVLFITLCTNTFPFSVIDTTLLFLIAQIETIGESPHLRILDLILLSLKILISPLS